MPYRAIASLQEVQTYLYGAAIVAFDFETAPDEPYRGEDKAALDAHKSHIVGISFSATESHAVYLPLAHRIGMNASDQPAIWEWLSGFFADPTTIKIAHNLAFESMFLYARGIVLQEPCYDTIAAAQLIYKKEMGIDIRLIFALPCRDQDAVWTQKEKQFYRELLTEADEITYVSEDYDSNCMKRRNQYMVDQSAYCICALLHEKSGTGQTVRYALRSRLHITNILLRA